jgi:hypothetical protein
LKFTLEQAIAHQKKHGFGPVLPNAQRRAPGGATVKESLSVQAESPLEAKFLMWWTACDGPELRREAAVIPGRLFRIDFLHESSKTAIELQGFRDHTSRKGFARDIDKFFMLQVDLGYTVVCLNRAMVTEENIWKLIRFCRGEQP